MRRLLVAGLAASFLLVSVLALRGQGTGDNPHGDLQIDCGECHNPERWTPVDKPPTFRHGRTGFALDSAHGRVSCRGCHRSLVFNQVGTACADCHKDSHRGELGTRCESCHTPTTWTNQREIFQAHNRSRFPLFVSHARLDCTACHRGQNPYQYKNTSAECGNCHLSTYLATTNPSHVQGGFSRRCEDCHNVTSSTWRSAAFEHPASFPLAGGHAGVVCARCHTGGSYAGTSPQCASCHQKDFAAATNPNHAASGFPQQCENCHTIAVVAAGDLRSQPDALCADRGPYADRLREVPPGRALHGHAERLQLVPPGELRGDDEPEPRGVEVLDAVQRLPQHGCVAAGELRPQQDALCAERGPRADRLCEVPPGRALHGHAPRLLLVPPGEVHGDDEPEPRGVRVRDDVPDLPQHERVEAGDLRPQPDPLCADRRAHEDRLREMPRGGALRRDGERLLLVPPGEVHGHDEPEPRRGRLPDAVPELPQHGRVAAGELRPQRDEVRADGRAHTDRLREVPRGRALRGDADRLLLVPSGEVHGDDEPEPRRGRLPDAVPELPQHGRAGGRRTSITTRRSSR